MAIVRQKNLVRFEGGRVLGVGFEKTQLPRCFYSGDAGGAI